MEKTQRLPQVIYNAWHIRVVRVFDLYGWIAEHTNGQHVTSTDTYHDPGTALSYAKDELK